MQTCSHAVMQADRRTSTFGLTPRATVKPTGTCSKRWMTSSETGKMGTGQANVMQLQAVQGQNGLATTELRIAPHGCLGSSFAEVAMHVSIHSHARESGCQVALQPLHHSGLASQ